MANDHPAAGNRSGRQACNESTPAGSLDATHYEFPRDKSTTGRGLAKRLGTQRLLASCHKYDSIMVKHLFLPLMFPSFQSPLDFNCHALHQPPRQSSRSTLQQNGFINLLDRIDSSYRCPPQIPCQQPSMRRLLLPLSTTMAIETSITISVPTPLQQ